MEKLLVLAVLNSKYIHFSPAPYCIASGIKQFSNSLYQKTVICETTINQPLGEFEREILSHNPKVVAFSCYIWNIEKTLELCESIKKQNKDIVTMVGGPEVSYNAAEVLKNNSFIDVVVSGEGEKTVPLLLERLIDAKFNPSAIEKISGVTTRDFKWDCEQNDSADFCEYPPSPIEAGYAKNAGGRITYFETSRGCPFRCAFCLSGQNEKPRYFDLDKKLQELLVLANSDTKTIKFVDRTFNASASHSEKILLFIKQNFGKAIPKHICFHFEIAADILSEKTFQILETMPKGAVQLEIGMQSFCEKTLLAINRKTDIEKLKRNIKRLVSFGNMHIHIDLIAGLPFEDLLEFEKSFNTGYSLCSNMLQVGFLKLLHGSDMKRFPERYPAVFDIKPPYQVVSTPWLSKSDIKVIQNVEDALERIYNSGRFKNTIHYVLSATGKTPFELYRLIGEYTSNFDFGERISLDGYTEFLKDFLGCLPGISGEVLRDMLVVDRLSTNKSGRLPEALRINDKRLKQAVIAINQNFSLEKGIKRSVALLYSEQNVVYVDYINDKEDPKASGYKLNKIPFEEMFQIDG